MVISAGTPGDAKAIAKSKYAGDGNPAWASATVTTLSDVACNAAGALTGWRLNVKILDASPVVDETVTGVGGTVGIDGMGTLMVAALNALSAIAGAAYNSGTQTLTIAETTDSLGDKKVTVEFLPPATEADPEIPIPGMVGTITDEGTTGAALSVVFGADTLVRPTVLGQFNAGKG